MTFRMSGTREHVSMLCQTELTYASKALVAPRRYAEERVQAATGVLEGGARLRCPGEFRQRRKKCFAQYYDACSRNRRWVMSQELERMERETLQLRHQIEQV